MKTKPTKSKKEKVVADRLRQFRIDAELSQQALAELAGIDRKTVNRIENNHFSPNLDTLLRLCVALSVKPVRLFDGIK
jgi:DNA-binding XRE family transcriptional regulator